MKEDFTVTDKHFNQLTTEEATALANKCKIGAQSIGEIRRRLTKAGFNGDTAALTSTSYSNRGMTILMVTGKVRGPRGEVISF